MSSSRGHRESCPIDCKVYVGELGTNGTRHELEEAFGTYGRVRNVWVATNPPGFAFVMFDDARDAKEACRSLDGKMICGRRVRVEMSTGRTRHDKDRYGGGRGGDRYGGGGYRGRGSPPPRGGPPRGGRGEYRDSRRSDDYGRDEYRRKRYSRSRSRSATPVRRSGRDGHVRDGGRPRTPPSRSPDSNSR